MEVLVSVLVAGASGFIGSRLFNALEREGGDVVALVRNNGGQSIRARIGDLTQPHTLETACAGVDTLYHCAGFAHAWAGDEARLSARHWAVNFEGTRNLFEAAGRAGVRRAVFLSSVKAMGEPGDRCVDEDWPVEPMTAYGQAKRAAEEAVLSAGHRYGMHVVNLRLAMVYGPGGRGNLERMAAMIRRGFFPALPETGNRRSLVHVDDVVAAVCLVAEAAAAAGRTYIVADERAYSGQELYAALRSVLGMPKARSNIPKVVLQGLARTGDCIEKVLARRLPFNTEVLDKLLGSACYSPQRIHQELGWKANVTLLDGLRSMLECDASH